MTRASGRRCSSALARESLLRLRCRQPPPDTDARLPFPPQAHLPVAGRVAPDRPRGARHRWVSLRPRRRCAQRRGAARDARPRREKWPRSGNGPHRPGRRARAPCHRMVPRASPPSPDLRQRADPPHPASGPADARRQRQLDRGAHLGRPYDLLAVVRPFGSLSPTKPSADWPPSRPLPPSRAASATSPSSLRSSARRSRSASSSSRCADLLA